MHIAGRFPGGRALRRRRKTGVQFTAGNGCEGPQPSRPPPNIVATNGWAIAGRSPDRGRDEGRFAPPSEPNGRISRLRLSSWWLTFKKIDKPRSELVLRSTSPSW